MNSNDNKRPFKVRTGLYEGYGDHDWEVHEFETEAERRAFIKGVSLANERIKNGWLDVERVE